MIWPSALHLSHSILRSTFSISHPSLSLSLASFHPLFFIFFRNIFTRTFLYSTPFFLISFHLLSSPSSSKSVMSWESSLWSNPKENAIVSHSEMFSVLSLSFSNHIPNSKIFPFSSYHITDLGTQSRRSSFKTHLEFIIFSPSSHPRYSGLLLFLILLYGKVQGVCTIDQFLDPNLDMDTASIWLTGLSLSVLEDKRRSWT